MPAMLVGCTTRLNPLCQTFRSQVDDITLLTFIQSLTMVSPQTDPLQLGLIENYVPGRHCKAMRDPSRHVSQSGLDRASVLFLSRVNRSAALSPKPARPPIGDPLRHGSGWLMRARWPLQTGTPIATRAVNQDNEAIVTDLEQSTGSQQREHPLEDCSQTNQHNQDLQQVR
jgi:hypothetical protein